MTSPIRVSRVLSSVHGFVTGIVSGLEGSEVVVLDAAFMKALRAGDCTYPQEFRETGKESMVRQ
jgi:hypothetical protein